MIALDMLIKFIKLILYFITVLFYFQVNTSIITADTVIEIDNPKFSEKGLNDKIYEIKAEKGFKRDDYLDLFTIKGKFKTNKGQWIYLEADNGNYSQSSSYIELKHKIKFYTEDGEKIKSKFASFDMINEIIEFKENVIHENLDIIILADKSKITNNFNLIQYEGNVLTTFLIKK